MTDIDLNATLARLNSLEVDPIVVSPPITEKEQTIKRSYYPRHGFLANVKEKLKILSNSVKIQDGDLIVDNYFIYGLNPLYQKIAHLPKKIFICGYCKEPFFTPAQYLKHCYIENCPINHERSTYFFKFKNSQKPVLNEDLRKQVTKKQLLKLLETDYGRDFIFLSYQQSLIGDGTKNYDPSSEKCSICSRTVLPYKNKIKNHAILLCPARNVLQPKSMFKFLYFDQPLSRFVEEIINFQLNLNILCLYQNSYLKVVQNKSLKTVHKFQCSSCGINFDDEQTFLSHVIFSCRQKSINRSQNPTHLLKLQPLPQYGRLKAIFPDFSQVENRQKVQKESILCHNWIEMVNEKYGHLNEFLSNSYFCGQCLNFFHSSLIYLAHCVHYGCLINHRKSSHVFLSEKQQRPLKPENIPYKIIRNQLKKIIYDLELLKKMNFKLQIKNNSLIKVNSKYIGSYGCGKCQKVVCVKDSFIQHLFIVCQSHKFYKNSHSIEPTNNLKTDEEYEDIIANHFYGMKIAESSFGYKFVLSKNDKIRFQGNYFCGSCETSFQSQEEFVYHSISVCQSLESQNSSHFIRKIYNSTATVENPILNLIEETKKSYNQTKSKTQKQQKSIENEQFEDKMVQKPIKDKKNSRKKKNAPQKHVQQKEEEDQEFFVDDKFDKKSQKKVLKEQKSTQNHVQVDEYVRRFLRFNVDCELPPNAKFYCGECQCNFKTNIKFIEHLEQICQAFQHKQSSHFYIPNKRIHEIYNQITFGNAWENNVSFPHEFTIYQPKKSDQLYCPCGKADFVSNISYHRKYHTNLDPCKEEHFRYLDIRLVSKNASKLIQINMPSFLKNTKQDHQFVCPCKPWKKLSYEAFTKHLIKRHGGRTPKFLMRLPKAQQQIEI